MNAICWQNPCRKCWLQIRLGCLGWVFFLCGGCNETSPSQLGPEMDSIGERTQDPLRAWTCAARRLVYLISIFPWDDFTQPYSFASLRTCRRALSTKVARVAFKTLCILTSTTRDAGHLNRHGTKVCSVHPGSLCPGPAKQSWQAPISWNILFYYHI